MKITTYVNEFEPIQQIHTTDLICPSCKTHVRLIVESVTNESLEEEIRYWKNRSNHIEYHLNTILGLLARKQIQ